MDWHYTEDSSGTPSAVCKDWTLGGSYGHHWLYIEAELPSQGWCAQSTLHTPSNTELAESYRVFRPQICSKSSTKRVCSQESTEDRPDSFSVRISFLQIYQDAAWAAEVVAVPTMSCPQEKIYDLLNPAPFLQGLTHAGSPDRLGPFLRCFGVVLSSQNRQRSQNSTLAEILC